MAQALTDGELSQRVLTLKRFREMLRTQRDRLREYLSVLDTQQDAIARGDAEALLSRLDLEEHIVRDLSNLQRVIDPLERLYRDLAASGGAADSPAPADGEAEVAGLKAAVERLGKEAAANAARNRELLAGRMAELRSEIKSLRGNPYAERRSIYADSGGALMVDVEG
jgi:chromosome segregation ATPase